MHSGKGIQLEDTPSYKKLVSAWIVSAAIKQQSGSQEPVVECGIEKHYTSLCPEDSQPASRLPVVSNTVTTQATEGVPTVPTVATFQ